MQNPSFGMSTFKSCRSRRQSKDRSTLFPFQNGKPSFQPSHDFLASAISESVYVWGSNVPSITSFLSGNCMVCQVQVRYEVLSLICLSSRNTSGLWEVTFRSALFFSFSDASTNISRWCQSLHLLRQRESSIDTLA